MLRKQHADFWLLLFRIETTSPKLNILRTENLDVEQEGLVVDINYLDTGTEEKLFSIKPTLLDFIGTLPMRKGAHQQMFT